MKNVIFAAAFVVSGAFAAPVSALAETLPITTNDTGSWTIYTADGAGGLVSNGAPVTITSGSPVTTIAPFGSTQQDGPGFWIAETTFNLDTLTGASLLLSWFGADDRVALSINGTIVGGVGIYNATYLAAAQALDLINTAAIDDLGRVNVFHTIGYIDLTSIPPLGIEPVKQDVYFAENGASPVGLTVAYLSTFLQEGTNVIRLIVNNTDDTNNLLDGGWSGEPTTGSPTWVGFSAALTYQAVAVPGPVAGAGIPALLVLGGALIARRRRAA